MNPDKNGNLYEEKAVDADFIRIFPFGRRRRPSYGKSRGEQSREIRDKIDPSEIPGVLKYDCEVSRKGNITFYEAAVPWSELGVKPDSGKVLRFGLVVFDKNSQTMKSAPYHLAITPGGGTDSGAYRLMHFEK